MRRRRATTEHQPLAFFERPPRAGLLAAIAIVVGACSSAAPGMSLEEFQAAAAPLCDQFAASLHESASLDEAYGVASASLQALGPVSAEDAETLVSAMGDTAALAETLQAGIDAVIEPGEVWFLTEDGQVWVGSSWIFASPTDTPVETGIAFFDALAALRNAAMAVALPACAPPEGQ